MPWVASDAKGHTSKADTPAKRKKWAATANAAREKALKDGHSEKEADAAAVRIANASLDESLEPSTEHLREYCANAGVKPRIDRESGVLYGVKMLGTQSRNRGVRHFAYPPATLIKAAPLYEGVVSNVDHHKDGEPVPYRDRIGIFRNVTAREEGLFGDFHFNPKHPLAEQLCWDAEHAPEKLGFSHIADGKVNRSDPKHPVVEEITVVDSVDLVANPATTHGLYESEDEITDPETREMAEQFFSTVSNIRTDLIHPYLTAEYKRESMREQLVALLEAVGIPPNPQETVPMEWKDITPETLKENRKDLFEVLTGTDATSKLMAEVKALKDNVVAKEAALKEANDKLASVEAEKTKQAKTLAISEELKAAGLDASNTAVVSEVFMEALNAAKDAEARKRLIEDRKRLCETRTTPTGTPPFAPLGGTHDKPARTKEELLKRL